MVVMMAGVMVVTMVGMMARMIAEMMVEMMVGMMVKMMTKMMVEMIITNLTSTQILPVDSQSFPDSAWFACLWCREGYLGIDLGMDPIPIFYILKCRYKCPELLC
jgi:hypothetical protein